MFLINKYQLVADFFQIILISKEKYCKYLTKLLILQVISMYLKNSVHDSHSKPNSV